MSENRLPRTTWSESCGPWDIYSTYLVAVPNGDLHNTRTLKEAKEWLAANGGVGEIYRCVSASRDK
jgi:hypothetical protein